MGVAVSSSRVRRAVLQLEHWYYRSVAPVRGARKRRPGDPVYDLDGWVGALRTGAPVTRIVVVAAGPSANTYEPRPGDLVVATNSSEDLVREVPYVYFLSESYHVDRTLKRGPQWPSCRGIVYRMAAEGLPAVQVAVSSRVVAHGRRYVGAVPELVASDREPTGVERDNFTRLSAEVLALLGAPLRQYNSGFGAAYLGLVLAARLGASLCLYGLDAGVGGPAHFDGSAMQSASVVSDRTREKLGELLDLLEAQATVTVENRSAFRPSSPA
ncbi:MAG: hypothetical protein JWO77_800 [Ilumatobacteraceae bacterium]|nr:hypothetical protein [Ilumatobacteraceae bacterium]